MPRSARAIAKLGFTLQNYVQQNKLSGQALNVHTGTLKSSIEVAIEQGPTSVTATVFTDLGYGTAQSTAFRYRQCRGELRLIKEAFGRPIAAKRSVWALTPDV